MKYWTTKLFDILIKILRQYPELIFIVFVIFFIIFVSLITWMYVSFKKQSKQTTDAFIKQVEKLNEEGVKRSENINIGLSNVQVGFDSAVLKMSEEINKFQTLLIKYQIINEEILEKDFNKIKDMVKLQTSIMIDQVVIIMRDYFERPNPFDISDFIANELHESSATKRNDLRSSKIPPRVIDIYEEAEVDLHNTIDGYILKFANKANNILSKTGDIEHVKSQAEITKNLIVDHILKSLRLRLSVKE